VSDGVAVEDIVGLTDAEEELDNDGEAVRVLEGETEHETLVETQCVSENDFEFESVRDEDADVQTDKDDETDTQKEARLDRVAEDVRRLERDTEDEAVAVCEILDVVKDDAEMKGVKVDDALRVIGSLTLGAVGDTEEEEHCEVDDDSEN